MIPKRKEDTFREVFKAHCDSFWDDIFLLWNDENTLPVFRHIVLILLIVPIAGPLCCCVVPIFDWMRLSIRHWWTANDQFINRL